MRRNFEYLKYILRHKWSVFLACRVYGVSLWRAVIHDWTKFLPIEWSAYALNFFNADGTRCDVRDKSGAYDPTAQPSAFQRAWLHHQRNRHHWQSWILIGDYGNLQARPIPEMFIREMVADWQGAGMAISGRATPHIWWEANKHKMFLHQETVQMIERLLSLPPSEKGETK
jgi:hypothetical protein